MITDVLLLELIIAQSPDKIKGLAMGIMLAFRGFVSLINEHTINFLAVIVFV